MQLTPDIGVYILYAAAQHLGLGHIHGRAEGAQLPVYIAQTNGVLIYKRQMPNAASRKRLGAPRANSAESEHRDMCAPELFHRLSSEKHFGAYRSFVHSISP